MRFRSVDDFVFARQARNMSTMGALCTTPNVRPTLSQFDRVPRHRPKNVERACLARFLDAAPLCTRLVQRAQALDQPSAHRVAIHAAWCAQVEIDRCQDVNGQGQDEADRRHILEMSQDPIAGAMQYP